MNRLKNTRKQRLLIALVVLAVIVSYPLITVLSADRGAETAVPTLIADAPATDTADTGQGELKIGNKGGPTEQGNSWGG